MFISFKITNYLSIADEQTLSLATTYKSKINSINNIACMVGANGSGKTNILKAILSFLLFGANSYLPEVRNTIRFTPHFTRTNKPSEFSVTWMANGKKYIYELAIHKSRVVNEILKEYGESNRPKAIFSRRNGKIVSNILKINKNDLERFSDDISLLSFLLHYKYLENYKDAIGVPFSKVMSNVAITASDVSEPHFIKFLKFTADKLKTNKKLFDVLVNELKVVDTGINNMDFERGIFEKLDAKTNTSKGISEVDSLITYHRINGKDYKLMVLDESDGTKNYIAMFIRLYEVLMSGGIILIDELERSLHVDLVERILNLFTNKDTNPNGAQIVFSTHNPWFLQFLDKSQIFIVEKDETQNTTLTRLDDYAGVRNDENYFIKYINGAYDGKPKIKEELWNG